MKTYRDSVDNGSKLKGQERTLFVALYDLVDEMAQWDTPQTDDNGEFGEDTALGYAIKVLKEVI